MLPSSYLTGGTSPVTEQTCGFPIAWCKAPWTGSAPSNPRGSGEQPQVPTKGHVYITPCTDGHLCASHPTGPPALSVQAKCNPCLSSPCQNQGTCHNDPLGSYRCACPGGYKVPWSQGSPVRGEMSLQRAGEQSRASAMPLGLAACGTTYPPCVPQHPPEWEGESWAGAVAPFSLPPFHSSPGQGLRGGTQWLLLQPLCQRRDLPASGGGRSWVQVSAGQEPMKSGCLSSSMVPWHPMERSSDTSFASCMLPWAYSWDIAFEWELQLMLSDSTSPCPPAQKAPVLRSVGERRVASPQEPGGSRGVWDWNWLLWFWSHCCSLRGCLILTQPSLP